MLPIPFMGQLVLLDEERQRLHLLNASAAAIWTALHLGPTRDTSVSLLAEHSGRERADCAADMAMFEEQWALDEALALATSSGRKPRERSDAGPPLYYRLNDRCFSFASEDVEVRKRVHASLSDLATSEAAAATSLFIRSDERGDMDLLVDGKVWLTSADAGDVVGGVFHQLLVGAHREADWLAMIHSGALVRDGSAVLFPGKSGAGKSTLIGYLARRGFTYLSDDLAAIGTDGRVVPWPTPLSIKRGSWSALADIYPALETLPEKMLGDRRLKQINFGRSGWTTSPATVRAIIMPRWSRRHAPATDHLEPHEALASLINDRVWLGWPMTEAHVRRFLDWLCHVPAYRIWYHDLADAEQRVNAILSDGEHTGQARLSARAVSPSPLLVRS